MFLYFKLTRFQNVSFFSQDIEIIAIDPNSFYTSSDEDDGDDEDESDVAAVAGMNEQNGNIHLEIESPTINQPIYHSMAFDMQPSSSDDFDIITLNIDGDDIAIDTQDDDILFRNEHQFDLANYISGGSAGSECSSLLLTPIKNVTASTATTIGAAAAQAPPPSNLRHHTQIPQFLLPKAMNVDPNKMPNNIQSIRLPINTAAAHATVAKTPASNRRKRKNLSREFILESDDTSDTDSNKRFNSVINNKINQMAGDRKANGKRKPAKEADPIWNPSYEKRNTIKSSSGRKESTIQHKNPHPKVPAKQANGQGKGLRNMLKQQFLSERPINTSKLLKTKSSPALSASTVYPITTITPNTVEKLNAVAQAPVHRIGVGRGKDIAITAKYYNRTESTDDEDDDDDDDNSNIEHQKSNKIYRYDQIYTDSDDSDMEIDVSSLPATVSAPLPDVKPELKIHSQEIAIPKADKSIEDKECKKTKRSNDKIASNKEKSKEENANHVRGSSVEKRTTVADSDDTKLNQNSRKYLLNSRSLDSTEFAKALVINAQAKTKSKLSAVAITSSSSSIAAAKKKNFEQQKRLIKSNILLQNPAKFKLLATEKKPLKASLTCAEPIGGTATVTTSANTNGCGHKVNNLATKPCDVVKEEPLTEAKPISANQIEPKIENTGKVENRNADETKDKNCAIECKEGNNPASSALIGCTETVVDDYKNEANAKRKLNIQEYLRRKSLKATGRNDTKTDQFVKSIKMEKSDAMSNSNKPEDKSNSGSAREEEEEGSNTGCLANNSMYEEIIIVSMGCNTDISIPKTPLLSKIQTSVVTANSKISCSSLISSIQDVLLKKSQCNAEQTTTSKDPRKMKAKSNGTGNNVGGDGNDLGHNDNNNDEDDEVEEHGENKTIMHLRKDRVRPMRNTISTQTDPYFQFPPLRKLMPIAKRQSTINDKTIKRVNSIARGASENRSLHHENHHSMRSHSGGNNRNNRINHAHRYSTGRSRLSESNYYSGDEEKIATRTQRPSRHSQFMEQHKLRQQQRQKRHYGRRLSSKRRESSRYSTSNYERYASRNRTISRSLSSTSASSSASSTSSSSSSTSSSTSTSSSSSSSAYASPRSLNSYGGSSSKSSYYVSDDHHRKRTTSSSNSRRNTHRQRTNAPKHRSNSPGL